MIGEINLTPTASFTPYILSGQEISVRSWGNSVSCKGIVILVHGLGAHSAWFEAVARQLKVRGMHVIAYDQKGFGLRKQAKVSSYQEWVTELSELFTQVKAANSGKPIYLLGNSMGALVVLAACQKIKPDGIIIASPGLDGHPAVFTWKYKIVSLLKAFLNPSAEIALPYSIELTTREPAVREWLLNDPYRRSSVPGGMMLELLKLTLFLDSPEKQVPAPILMFTAGVEKIVNNEYNRKYFAALEAPSKDSKHFDKAWHDLMFDPVVDELADSILHWQSRLILETSPKG